MTKQTKLFFLKKSLEESMDPKHYNFDHPKALDFDLIFEVCNKLLRRQNATVPLYSFKTNRRYTTLFEKRILIYFDS